VAQPEDFVRLAQLLRSEIGSNEGARRAVAHACYYAVYHLMALHFGIDPNDQGRAGHGNIRTLLNALRFTPPPPREVVIARRHFRTLMFLRARADYRLSEEFSAADALRALEMTEEIFAAMRLPGR
jgi:hypothetical protein